MSTIQKEKTEKTSFDEHQDAVIREEKNAQFDYDSEAYAVQDKRILRKLDWHLLPFVSLLYLLSFLDRSNIGNARVAGLVNDLKLVGYQYNICAAVFFLLYSACEIPSNIALKLFRPSIWIPSIMVAWGLVMFCMMFVKSYHGLLVARIFLGATEAGLFPGVTYYISLWYRKREQARRVAIFFSAATVAGAFGGILAYAIAKMDGIGGFEGWAWIFGLEGILTILVAVIAYFRMHDYPQTAKFLKQEERDHVVDRLKRDSSNMATHFAWKFVWQALSDWKAYIQVIIYIGVLIPVYAFSLFLPTIIVGLGFNAARAQLMTIPPYCVGCFFTVFVGIYSDKYHLRGPFNLACSAVAIAGYSVLYATSSPGAGYAGTIIAAAGVFPTVPVTLAWAGNNAGGDMKRGVVLAMVIGLGNLGGICSSFIYRSVDAPRFHIGHGTVIGCLLTLFVFSTFAMWNYKRLNKIKEEYCQREGITEDRANEFREMADDSPLFRYTI